MSPRPVPRHAAVLAAGLGTRMRPLSDAVPKPLLPLGGRPLLDHALDRLAAAGVEGVAVNAHWLAERLATHLDRRTAPPRTVLLREPELLDTGGALAAALAAGALGTDGAPFFAVNGDSFWLDGPTAALERLAGAWEPGLLGVLLVHRCFQVHAEVGGGDFHLDELGVPRRRGEGEVAPYVFAGVQLLSPALFVAAPAGCFGMNQLWDHAIAEGRLRALVHDGLWFHLSRPQDLSEAEQALFDRETGETT